MWYLLVWLYQPIVALERPMATLIWIIFRPGMAFCLTVWSQLYCDCPSHHYLEWVWKSYFQKCCHISQLGQLVNMILMTHKTRGTCMGLISSGLCRWYWSNRTISHILHCMRQIFHNVPFCNRNVHISVTKWGIMGSRRPSIMMTSWQTFLLTGRLRVVICNNKNM